MNSTKLIWILVLILLASTVSAGIGETLTDGFKNIWDFEPTYNKNPKTWDFILFALIFNIVSWLGLVKAFPDNKVAIYILAGVIGILLGLGAVKAGVSIGFFIPFVKNILYFMVAGLIFYILGFVFQMNKFWAFVLALVVSFVAFNVLGLFSTIDLSGELNRFKPDPSLKDIDAELYDMAGEHGIDLRGTTTHLERIEILKKALDAKIDARIKAKDTSSDGYKNLIKSRNRLIYLKTRAEFLIEQKEAEAEKALFEKLEPFYKELGELEKITDPVERLEKINELLKKIDERLSNVKGKESTKKFSSSFKQLEGKSNLDTLSAYEQKKVEFANNFIQQMEANPSAATLRNLANDAPDEETKQGMVTMAKVMDELEKPEVKKKLEANPTAKTVREIAGTAEDPDAKDILNEMANVMESAEKIAKKFEKK